MTSDGDNLILTNESLEAVIRQFTGRLSIYSRANRRQILGALHWSRQLHEGQKRDSGEPYIIHPIKVAEILIELKMEPTTILGALLHDVLEDTAIRREEFTEYFGEEVYTLVDGVTKIDDITIGKGHRKAASLRKMIWAMVDDLRIIFIKLADKCHNMRTLHHIKDERRRQRIARECLEIYAPMASKLGMSSHKSELEDYSFKYLKPGYYAQIQSGIAINKDARQQELIQMKEKIIHAASKARIKVQVDVRVKSFYSIYKKMKDRNKAFNEIVDFSGMRIICETTHTCYVMLGIVHSLWPPIEGHFKDYIAHPKSNGYQSIHTAVITKNSHIMETQIRNREMHETAEYGIAAHWAYKARKRPDQILPSEIGVVKQLQDLRNKGYDDDAGSFLDMIKGDVLRDSIIVYTPKGEPIELPEGSTAIDFAYHIHTEIGNHCRGAKADDSIIPLTRPLRNTQTIQILTSTRAHPHVNWLKHVRSARSRSKIRTWLNHNDTNVIIDREIVAKKNLRPPPNTPTSEKQVETRVIDTSKFGISVENGRNTLIKISRCCSPTPGDRITGYISRGRGIIVHKSSCPNLGGIAGFEDRRIHVEWETTTHKRVQRLSIHASNTYNLYSEIENSIRKYNGHIISGSLEETERGNLVGFFTVEMENAEDLKRITKSIRSIPAVLSISKVQNFQDGFKG